MKKFAYVFLIVIIIVLGFVIYSISASDIEQDVKEKVKTELEYFESKILYMFNSLNNIEFQNYKLSIEEISEKSKKSSENSSSAGNGDDTSGGVSSKNSSSEGEENSSGSSKEGSESGGNEQNSAEKTQKYSLNAKGVLNSEKEINWNYIKNEAETLQNSICTMTLDLYKIGLNDDDISNFSKEYDNLLIALKNENKEESLKELVTVYSYFPKFIKNCDVDPLTKVTYSTKYSIFKAYSLLDSENWEEIAGYLQEAREKFTKIITNESVQENNQFIVNKCYILLNEIQNSANLKDKQLFLIKYRNLLEDLNNL